jgi:hypothetical protein
MAALPGDFFTLASFGTLAGSVVITTAVTGSLNRFAGVSPAKSGFFASFAVVAAGLFLADKMSDPKADLVGFFNAFLVYLTAAGVSDAAAGKFRGAEGRAERPFFRSWFR